MKPMRRALSFTRRKNKGPTFTPTDGAGTFGSAFDDDEPEPPKPTKSGSLLGGQEKGGSGTKLVAAKVPIPASLMPGDQMEMMLAETPGLFQIVAPKTITKKKLSFFQVKLAVPSDVPSSVKLLTVVKLTIKRGTVHIGDFRYAGYEAVGEIASNTMALDISDGAASKPSPNEPIDWDAIQIVEAREQSASGQLCKGKFMGTECTVKVLNLRKPAEELFTEWTRMRSLGHPKVLITLGYAHNGQPNGTALIMEQTEASLKQVMSSPAYSNFRGKLTWADSLLAIRRAISPDLPIPLGLPWPSMTFIDLPMGRFSSGKQHRRRSGHAVPPRELDSPWRPQAGQHHAD